MNILELIFFGVAALITLVGGVATVAAKNPIRGAMGLLATIVGIAGLFLMLSAEFLAAIQILVYAGAVVVLFVFVIMVLGPAAEPAGPGGGSLFARALSILVLGGLGWRLLAHLYRTKRAATIPDDFGTIERVADALFGPYLFHFELVSILLLVAVVGAIAVAKGRLRARGSR